MILGRNEDEIKGFKQPNRRLNEYIIGNNILINDYTHHPTQIKSLYEYLSSKYPIYKKIIVFEGSGIIYKEFEHFIDKNMY